MKSNVHLHVSRRKNNVFRINFRFYLNMEVIRFRERILYMLHVSGALRCTRQQKNCFDGCFVKGINNGKTDEHISEILDQDESGKPVYLRNGYLY